MTSDRRPESERGEYGPGPASPGPSPVRTPIHPNFRERHGPGGLGPLWLTVGLVLTLVVFGLQQFQGFFPAKEEVVEGQILPPGNSDQLVFVSKILVKIDHVFDLKSAASTNLDPLADSPVSRVRLAPVYAEVGDLRSASRVLGEVEKDDDVPPAIKADAERLRRLYEEGTLLSPEEAAEMRSRHGWFTDLASVYQKPASDPVKAGMVAGGGALIALLLGFTALVGLALLSGIVIQIVGMLSLHRPFMQPRFVAPVSRRHVYAETFALFVALFLGLQLAIVLLEMLGIVKREASFTLSLTLQWLLLPLAFWPMIRGVRGQEAARGMGWSGERGPLREVLAGVLWYLAGIPVLFVAMLVTVVINLIVEAIKMGAGLEESGPPSNPIFELTGSGGLTLFLLFALATVWAPILEEAVFRGALYSYLRGAFGRHARWLSVILSTVVTAVCFGALHGYLFYLMLPVVTLGAWFAITREFRGSIIPTVTAHALHNGTVLALLIAIVVILG